MNAKIKNIILEWHGIYVAVGEAINSARVVLDQTDRGTLLPDRVREMRGELLAIQERIPALADLMEEMVDEGSWPTLREVRADTDAEAAAEMEAAAEPEAAADDEAIIGTTGEEVIDEAVETPAEAAPVDEEAAAEAVAEPVEESSEADATGTP